jgi:hypothetical protein
MRTEAEFKEKHGVWVPMPKLTITSPYVHSRVYTFTMGNPCQSQLYPPVRDFGFGLCSMCLALCSNTIFLHSLSEFSICQHNVLCKWLTRTVWLKGCELLTWNVCSKIFLVIMHAHIHAHIITLSLVLIDDYFCGLFMYLWVMWCTIEHSCLKEIFIFLSLSSCCTAVTSPNICCKIFVLNTSVELFALSSMSLIFLRDRLWVYNLHKPGFRHLLIIWVYVFVHGKRVAYIHWGTETKIHVKVDGSQIVRYKILNLLLIFRPQTRIYRMYWMCGFDLSFVKWSHSLLL